MEEMTMKLSLIELYDLVGDGMGISFNYAELPGVVVTIGFSREEEVSVEDEEENENDEQGNDNDGPDGKPRTTKSKLH